MDRDGRADSTHSRFREGTRRLLLAVTSCATLTVGCQGYRPAEPQGSPDPYFASLLGYTAARPVVAAAPTVSAVGAEGLLAEAVRLDRADDPQATSLYYQAAMQAWRQWNLAAAAGATEPQAAAEQTYAQCLAGLLDAAQRYGQYDPYVGLKVFDGQHQQVIPIVCHGFAWQPGDFSQLVPVGDYRTKEIAHHYAGPGVGLPMVALRCTAEEQQYFVNKLPFPVTVLLRPATCGIPGGLPTGGFTSPGPAVLELYNPFACLTVDVAQARWPLAYDLSASQALLEREAPNRYLQGFIAPNDASVRPKLLLLEPYQRGKIPVVFIHGLFSDTLAWLDVVNELRARPEVYNRFQLWVFRYPTGGGLLDSAAKLRQDLQLARQQFDPAHQDPALDDMVLVGHSMGGLVAKFQITCSRDDLWRSIANQPLANVRTNSEMRQTLSEMFFFDPVPSVRRVVYVGTPFQGSNDANRVFARLSSNLVRFGKQENQGYQQLMDDNRDIFIPLIWKSRPTSIDLLEPSSPLLQALEKLSVKPDVCLHTVIGTGAVRIVRQPSDGVVDISSAQQPGVASESHVVSLHSALRRAPGTISELERVLNIHAAQFDAAHCDARQAATVGRRN